METNYKNIPLTIEAIEDSVVKINQFKIDFATYELTQVTGLKPIDLKYSVNGVTLPIDTFPFEYELLKGQVIEFKGNNISLNDLFEGHKFDITGQVIVYGNINSLVDEDLSKTELKGQRFCKLFMNCEGIMASRNLELPSSKLTSFNYDSMFKGCSNMVFGPSILPSMSLDTACYQSMFEGCSSLIRTPELPATVLTDECYFNMFKDCSSLVDPPELPSTNLAFGCYCGMFDGCTSLKTAPKLPASFVDYGSYTDMFKGCINLLSIPELNATSISKASYNRMFKDCSSLKYVFIRFIRDSDTQELIKGYENMFYDCDNLIEVNLIDSYLSIGEIGDIFNTLRTVIKTITK